LANTPQMWQLEELTADERQILEQIYGHQPLSAASYTNRPIMFVRELHREEQKYFAQKNFMSANFVTQILYKVKGHLLPIDFNRSLRQMVDNLECLRTNYCPMGDKTLAVVFRVRREMPEVMYRNISDQSQDEIDTTLEKFMEADMRHDFDLMNGNLIRFSVFRTSENEYAVLTTATQFVLNNLPVYTLFGNSKETQTTNRNIKTSTLPAQVDAELEKAMTDYWTNSLAHLPAKSILPFSRVGSTQSYNQRVARMVVPAQLMSDLRKLAKSNKMMLMAFLNTAWGLLLQSESNTSDTVFCTLVPNKMNGSVNTLPLRLKCNGSDTIEQIVSATFKRSVIARPYSALSWDNLLKIMGSGKRDTFDHFLSFYDFLEQTVHYSEVEAEPCGKMVTQNSWDAKGPKLALYFRYEENKIIVNFFYNEYWFKPRAGERLIKSYSLMLQQMVTDWSATWADFMRHVNERLNSYEVRTEEEILQNKQRIVTNLEIMQGVDHNLWQEFVNRSTVLTLYEGDSVEDSIMQDSLVFVGNGRVSRSIEGGDGWYNTMDILKPGSWINESVLLPEAKNKISATVLTDRAEILTISRKSLDKILFSFPELWPHIVEYVLKRMEKYQRLWLMS